MCEITEEFKILKTNYLKPHRMYSITDNNPYMDWSNSHVCGTTILVKIF